MTSIITKHLEYVAQLEAQLHGLPYYAVAEHTAALAKRALETELVRLDDTATKSEKAAVAETDTWKSHIKTLEWLLKLPTLSLTFETFKSVLTDEHVELVQLFLKLTDPSADDNYAICVASLHGYTNLVKVQTCASTRQQTTITQFAGQVFSVIWTWSRFCLQTHVLTRSLQTTIGQFTGKRSYGSCQTPTLSLKIDNHSFLFQTRMDALTITKHLEYVAQVEAELYGSPYYAVAERTAALAKRALETELVRLDETNTTSGKATYTWTSHIKTLEWLVKLPTMSLTFETFKSVLTDEHVELIQLFLTLTDPSAEDNYAIRIASTYGQTEVVKVLLADVRVDPSAEDNYAIRIPSGSGQTDVVKVLLADPRVDPSARINEAIRMASAHGHTEVVNMLLADPRVDPSANDNYAIRLASYNGHTDVVKVLLADPRLSPPDPSARNNESIRMACYYGHTDVVKVLLADPRVDPSANNNYAIRMACSNGHTDVVKVIRTHPRVNPSLAYNKITICVASENGHTDVVKVLLADPRVDPSAYDNHAIRSASANGHSDVVKVLLADSRVDPSAQNNSAIRMASLHGHTDVVKVLLADDRVPGIWSH